MNFNVEEQQIIKKLQNDKSLYENCFEYKDDLYLRFLDGITKKSKIINLGNDKFIPPLYIESQVETPYKSFNDNVSLEPIYFDKLKEFKNFTYRNKANIYGNKTRSHYFLNQVWTDPLKSNHDFNTIWLDIETESGRLYNEDLEITIQDPKRPELDGVIKTIAEWKKDPIIELILKKRTLELENIKIEGILKERKKDTNIEYYEGLLNTNNKQLNDIFPLINVIKVLDPEDDQIRSISDASYFRIPGFPNSEKALYKTTVIQMYSTELKEFIILGYKKWTGNYKSKHGKIRYIQCHDEKDMLRKYVNIIDKIKPTAMNSFNGLTFDYPYLVNRMYRLKVDYKKLSPIGVVIRDVDTIQDGKNKKTCDIKGVFLLDTLELVKKYSFLSIPNFSLEMVAQAFKIRGKVSLAAYESFQGSQDGSGYIFPKEIPTDEDDLKIYNAQVLYRDNPTSENKEIMQQIVYDNFITYSIRDVDVMLDIEDKAKVSGTAKMISYICGCNVNEVSGTLKQWVSYMHNETRKDNIFISVKQLYGRNDVIYKAGWTSSKPGKLHKWIVSFDFSGLYPSLIKAFNIGADSLFVPKTEQEHKIVNYLKNMFNYYSHENFGENGKLHIKYKGETNDIPEELAYFNMIMNTDITKALNYIDCSITPNGELFKRKTECYSSRAMRVNIINRNKAKHKGIALSEDVEIFKGKFEELGIEDINEIINEGKTNEHYQLVSDYIETVAEMEYQDSLSLSLKVHNNSFYGAGALKSNPFTNGKVTNEAITTSGRFSNMFVAQALSNKIRELLGKEPEESLEHVVQVDTDSSYISLEELIEAKMPGRSDEDIMIYIQDVIKNHLKPIIDSTINDINNRLNARDHEALAMDQEIVADVFCSIASKRYFSNIKMKDGVKLNKDKIKSTGISLVSKSTPESIKALLKPVLRMVLKDGERVIKDYIRKNKEPFLKLCQTSPVSVSKAQSVNSLEYYFVDNYNVLTQDWKSAKKLVKPKGEGKFQTAPINSKASVIHNFLIKDHDLGTKYTEIQPADKIKMVYLKTPNPITGLNNNIVAFKNEQFLLDLGLEKYVDTDKQWEGEFINKIKLITDSLNMNMDYENNDIDFDEW